MKLGGCKRGNYLKLSNQTLQWVKAYNFPDQNV